VVDGTVGTSASSTDTFSEERMTQERIDDHRSERAPSQHSQQRRPQRRPEDHETWSLIWSAALPPAPARVLDVATGTGHVAFVLADLGHDVTGIDLAEGMLAEARSHAEGRRRLPQLRRGDAVEPDFPAESFDAITARYAMWTLREPCRAVSNWLRLLRPGGVIAVVDGTWFPGGPPETGDPSEDASEFVDAHSPEVWGQLPLAGSNDIEDTAAVFETAGAADVRITPLPQVLDLDQKHRVAPGHRAQLQYLVTARKAS
jgi:SAM-dependent methyltransferase